jgi:hypothetical protein
MSSALSATASFYGSLAATIAPGPRSTPKCRRRKPQVAYGFVVKMMDISEQPVRAL